MAQLVMQLSHVYVILVWLCQKLLLGFSHKGLLSSITDL